ncbi:hypothetical protein MAMC_00062 [Methylacidimicrobium cyclopophantes]|uniref:L,D-TPase catalytic domain-containing protein n=1 Tax=Methylacidimicrobium cyclopophantes TaxID=1041766 RepID=A0A5E6M537_9BACT|nr:L,D-transpeptidase [Methylacidimicrobium cyclopophantes]VVM04447.1 hypothetical protein MAMC_00062 [Methylacidimicrobium cyclopophantes]
MSVFLFLGAVESGKKARIVETMRTFRHPSSTLAAALSLFALALSVAYASAPRKQHPASWTGGAHHRVRPSSPKRIVKVSLVSRVVYVLEGDRPLLVAPTCSGKPGHITPTGVFHVTGKAKRRRSGKYGFWVKNGQAVEGIKVAGPPDKTPGWKFVGYPMPFWVGFSPGYGFHEGFLWSTPKTHGCLHLTGRDAERFYELVERGTRISIRQTQPEDPTLGKEVHHPEDEKAPNPPSSFFLSNDSFTIPWEDVLKPGTSGAGKGIGAGEPSTTNHKEPGQDKSRESDNARLAARPS